MNNNIIVYAVLNEDRGGDTEVTLHANYKDAKKVFNEIVKQLEEDCTFFECDKNHIDNWELKKDHLLYDFGDAWGNIEIYKKSFKIDDFLTNPHDQKLPTTKTEDFDIYQGFCPVCKDNDLEYVDGCLEYQELECSKGHRFVIDCLGWEVSEIKKGDKNAK